MRYFLLALLFYSCSASKPGKTEAAYDEPHRPQIHFSPKAHWMNDPNGLVYYKGTYHLFFQYYPDSTVWGPMHWGHAVSTDLVHWNEMPVALFPDSLGYIFSGSVVVDSNNTSGLGKEGKMPMVAIFTYHDPKGEREGRNDYQTQGLAYSLDEGRTWTKYAKNPVLHNPGLKDFRDPKIRWYEDGKKWIMTLATHDRISFYSSTDLKNWTRESEFGSTTGAHGGVWECPDLFPMTCEGETVWVLLVSINPGGPNGGSATQYFTGHFNGSEFISSQADTRWIDYGPDNYAGVTWSNVGKRHLFLGWMGNWNYAQKVPTHPWRSAMTIPRDLQLIKKGNDYFLASNPVKELDALNDHSTLMQHVHTSQIELAAQTGKLEGPARLSLHGGKTGSFKITLSNDQAQQLVVGYDQASNQYYIDRSATENIQFEKGFGARALAPRISQAGEMDLELVIDNASVELFADGGLTVMTGIFFPSRPYTEISLTSSSEMKWDEIQLTRLLSIWPKAKK